MGNLSVRLPMSRTVDRHSRELTKTVSVNESQNTRFSLTDKPAPFRSRYTPTVGKPLLYQKVWGKVRTQAARLPIGQNPVNDLPKRSGTVTLTVNQTLRLTVTVTAPNRYGRVQ